MKMNSVEKSLTLPFDEDETALQMPKSGQQLPGQVEQPDSSTQPPAPPEKEEVPEGRVKAEWGESRLNLLVCPHCKSNQENPQQNPVKYFVLRWRSDGNSVEPNADAENDYYCASNDYCERLMSRETDKAYPVSLDILESPEFRDRKRKSRINSNGLIAISRLGDILGVKNPTEQKLRDLDLAKTNEKFKTVQRTDPAKTELAKGAAGDIGIHRY